MVSALPEAETWRGVSCAPPNVRVIPPQPFAPGGKCRFARVRTRLLAATSLRPCARLLRNLRGCPPKASLSAAHLRGANCAALGTGAFGRAGIVRACRRAARPAWGAPRICRMRAIRPRRNTAFAAWPRPGGADGRPAVREALGRASAPVPPLRARGTTFGFPYGASLALAPTLRRRSAAGSRRIEDNPPYHGRARYP